MVGEGRGKEVDRDVLLAFEDFGASVGQRFCHRLVAGRDRDSGLFSPISMRPARRAQWLLRVEGGMLDRSNFRATS